MTRQKKELSVEELSKIGAWMLVALVATKAGEKLRPKVALVATKAGEKLRPKVPVLRPKT